MDGTKGEEQTKNRRFSQKQYDFLKHCCEREEEGIQEWNEWRKENPNEKILLEGADLNGAYLRKANLAEAYLFNGKLQKAKCHFVDFEGATLLGADLRGASLYAANLKNTKLGQESEAVEISFKSLRYVLALQRRGIELGADLRGAILWYADLRGAKLPGTHLAGSDFRWATFDGSTIIRKCKINQKTDFRESSLSSARIDEGIKQLLEHNIRRKNWAEWFPKQHWLLAWLVRKFWEISDYGISTKGIITTFFKWAFVFAIVYYAWGCIDYYLLSNKDHPGIVSNLFVLDDKQQAVSGWLVPLRAVYFSIVTMTTLGFGDMYANAHSLFRGIFGHILLALQVILGYVLLGALVTRFAVLFTAGGPAGKFADEKEKEDKK